MTEPLLPSCFIPGRLEAGTDEAGRGCLAGPVFAAAVILPDDFNHPLLNDSKQMTERNRDILRPIIEKEAISWAVGIVTAREIDTINILRASILAMHRALDKLNPQPGGIIVDGNKFFPWRGVEHRTIVKGDGKYANIAAASVLAKTHRDEFMVKLSKEYPQYKWEINKGYPTVEHRAAVAQYGPSPYHRISFHLLPDPKK